MRNGISIVVCTFNGKERLGSTLEAIRNLDREVPKELLIVDNASTDGTAEWIKEYLNTGLNLPAKYIYESLPGLINARMAGVRIALYDLILFCDDDNCLFPSYLNVGLSLFESHSKMGVLGGFGIPKLKNEAPNWLSRFQKSFALGPQAENSGRIQSIPGNVYGAGSFFLKQPLLDLMNSGYRFYLTGRNHTQTISGDDLELCWLMQLMGYEIWYSEKLKFYHDLPETRMTTEYLVKMKSGTAAGSALLFSYRYFIMRRNPSQLGFALAYFSQLLNSSLLYMKNRLITPTTPTIWESDLALAILKSRSISFRTSFPISKKIFTQLRLKSQFWKPII